MKTILVVFGTRPEAIKMAPVIRSLRDEDRFEVVVCVTGQHREMLAQVLELFDIAPDVDLKLMHDNQTLTSISSLVLSGIGEVLSDIKPDIIMVHGDTATTMMTSLAGFFANIPIAHVEAGLRTYDLAAPFPEELSRQLTSKVSTYHFAPTEESKANLIHEGVNPTDVIVTGNTVIDALKLTLDRFADHETRSADLKSFLMRQCDFDIEDERYVLITGHRRENFGKGFTNICAAIFELAENFPKVHFVYPVHLNPNVQQPVYQLLSGLHNVHLIAPLDYEPFAMLVSKCFIVLTDSGGIQEEAPSLGKPVLVMRDNTERPEAVRAGTVKLVGTGKTKIIEEVRKLLSDSEAYSAMASSKNPYGDGNAASKIVDFLRINLLGSTN